MFLYEGWYFHKEKETSFLTLGMTNFGFTATSLVEIWTPKWSSTSTSRFHKEFFFFDRMVLFLSSLGLLLLFFLTKDFPPFFIFPRAKIFP